MWISDMCVDESLSLAKSKWKKKRLNYSFITTKIFNLSDYRVQQSIQLFFFQFWKNLQCSASNLLKKYQILGEKSIKLWKLCLSILKEKWYIGFPQLYCWFKLFYIFPTKYWAWTQVPPTITGNWIVMLFYNWKID